MSHFKSLHRMTQLLLQFMPKRTTSLIYQDGSASSHLLNIKKSSPDSLIRPSFVPSMQPLDISMDLKYHAATHMQLNWMNKVKPLAGKDAVALELQQIDEYQTFKDYGHHIKFKPPDGYKKIRVHLIFDIKHDGRHRAQLVADSHHHRHPT